MIKYREILRLRHEGVSVRNVALSCGCARSTVQRVTSRALDLGITWPLPEELDDSEIYHLLLTRQQGNSSKRRFPSEMQF